MTIEPIAFANIGRTNKADVVRSLQAIERGLPNGCTLILAEIGEGDRGYDEHALVQRTFSGWRIVHGDTREPILLDVAATDARVLRGDPWRRRTMRGIPRQSPPRHLQEVITVRADGTKRVDMTVHYPAGAKNGSRAPHVKALLMAGWLNTRRKHRARIRHHVRRGHDVRTAFDANKRGGMKLHRRQVAIFTDAPDYGIAIPGKGRTVRIVDRGSIPLYVEPNLHRCLIGATVFTAKENR